MKKIKTLALFTISVLSLSLRNDVHAQTSKSAPTVYSANDLQLLKGFDAQSVINELKAKGIPQSEFPGILKHKKALYLSQQKGEKKLTSIPSNPPQGGGGPCINSGFEDVNFNMWTGATGLVPGTVWTPGFINGGLNASAAGPSRHTILTNVAGFDPVALNAVTNLPEIPLTAPGGGGVSVRLGNYDTGGETEKLDYPITVTPQNTSFTYQYAVVLESPTGHNNAEQPRFNIQVFDQFGTPVSGPCGVYAVEGLAAAGDTTFHPFNAGGVAASAGGFYKKWTTVGIDLTPYIGTTVTIEFQTADCTLGGHFGYAYIDCSCSQLQTNIAFCPNDTILMLTAPGGYSTYQWYDNNNILIPAAQGGTNDTLFIHNPVIGQIYSVSMFSLSGCNTSITTTLQYTSMQITDHFSNVSCFGLSDGLIYVTLTGANPPYTYTWTNQATGGSAGGNNDSLINLGPGDYVVHITSTGGCSGTDTIHITQPNVLPDTTAASVVLMCPNDTTVTLIAPAGALGYHWFQNGLPVSDALGGHNVVLTLHPPNMPSIGDTLYCALDCPHWSAVTLQSNNIQITDGHTDVTCYGNNDGSAFVNTSGPAAGPYFYSWTNSTGTVVNTTATYNNAYAGTYYVNVQTYGGCGKMDTIIINQPSNPEDSINLYTTFCMEDKNIVLRVPAGLGTYTWYAGTDTSASGIVLSTDDTLLIPNPVVGSIYTVWVHPPIGCDYMISSSLQYSPPPNLPNYIVTTNVFSPDGDGVNDKFDLNQFTYTKDFHVEIFNRWGKKVFESSDVHTQWDGRINGNPAEEGVYYWMASYTSLCTPGGESHESTGFVQVVRK